MRIIANLKQDNLELKRLMIYDSKHGTYLFGYKTTSDSSALWDNWFENIDDALKSCAEDYGISKNDWIEITDPLENCQHDWINPVRIKGRIIGKPEWGKLEKLENGKWIDLVIKNQ